jgi:hypothetical protein
MVLLITKGAVMLKNNIELDVKVKCIEENKTQAQIADEIHTTKQYVNRIIKQQGGVVNKTFIKMMDALGYDVELTYTKKTDGDK